jgi:pullulanase/glycogen debranching enzyme
LRQQLPHLSKQIYLHGRRQNEAGWHNIEWLNPAGQRMNVNQWHHDRTLTLLLPAMDDAPDTTDTAVAIMFNASDESLEFSLPAMTKAGCWKVVFNSSVAAFEQANENSFQLESRSIACALY